MVGSGKDGRILKEDVLRHMGEIKTPAPAKPAAPTPAAPAPTAPAPAAAPAPQPLTVKAVAHAAPRPTVKPVILGEDRTEPIKGIRKAMVGHIKSKGVNLDFFLYFPMNMHDHRCLSVNSFVHEGRK